MVRTIFMRRPAERAHVLTAAIAAFAILAGAASPSAKAADVQSAETTLRGKLIEIDGTKPALDPPGERTVMLAGRQHYIFGTLKDVRLAGNEVVLKGHMISGGFFQVDDIHTIHHGKLYWIRYYCQTCNIAALGPGNCVCCGQPTELQQVPVGEYGGPDPKGVIITH